MADRVSASITLGGTLSAADYAALCTIIASEDLSTDWDGDPFSSQHRTIGEPLRLFAHEVALGRFEALEGWCVEKRLSFARWSGGYPGQFGAQRLVFAGQGDPLVYAADEEDQIVLPRTTIEQLGSFDAVMAYFEAADCPVPALIVEGERAREQG
ncbi:hypothetical protein ACFOKF_22175 [Sphingobium rhizovicinum]|uniref:SMI1/KNR4 family protein n=1 Tax=Sphingobium rhizovicinum TaxID=432308 RepID=A0ABV7NLH6_9SPHN